MDSTQPRRRVLEASCLSLEQPGGTQTVMVLRDASADALPPENPSQLLLDAAHQLRQMNVLQRIISGTQKLDSARTHRLLHSTAGCGHESRRNQQSIAGTWSTADTDGQQKSKDKLERF